MQIEVMLVVMVVKAHGKEKMTPDTTPLNISKKKRSYEWDFTIYMLLVGNQD